MNDSDCLVCRFTIRSLDLLLSQFFFSNRAFYSFRPAILQAVSYGQLCALHWPHNDGRYCGEIRIGCRAQWAADKCARENTVPQDVVAEYYRKRDWSASMLWCPCRPKSTREELLSEIDNYLQSKKGTGGLRYRAIHGLKGIKKSQIASMRVKGAKTWMQSAGRPLIILRELFRPQPQYLSKDWNYQMPIQMHNIIIQLCGYCVLAPAVWNSIWLFTS